MQGLIYHVGDSHFFPDNEPLMDFGRSEYDWISSLESSFGGCVKKWHSVNEVWRKEDQDLVRLR